MTKQIDIPEATLQELYLEKKMSAIAIGKLLGIGRGAIYNNLKRYNIASRPVKEALALANTERQLEKSPQWKGGRIYDGQGYIKIMCPIHPKAHWNGYVFEHRLVWEQTHNKPLPEGYVVHHLNGIKDDNRPSNLIALPKTGHSPTILLQRVQEKLREVEIENRQLLKTLENSQMILYINEN